MARHGRTSAIASNNRLLQERRRVKGDPRMKILVIGAGGRARALAWKLAQSPRVDEVVVAPGNAGTATEDKCRNADVAATDIGGLLALARDEGVALTV